MDSEKWMNTAINKMTPPISNAKYVSSTGTHTFSVKNLSSDITATLEGKYIYNPPSSTEVGTQFALKDLNGLEIGKRYITKNDYALVSYSVTNSSLQSGGFTWTARMNMLYVKLTLSTGEVINFTK